LSHPSIIFHIRTFGDQHFDDLLVPPTSRTTQRSPTMLILRIHIRTSSQVLFNGFKVSAINSLNQRTIWIPSPHQRNGCDCCE
jgi:hypothetical protein